jgi:hypothetical protein
MNRTVRAILTFGASIALASEEMIVDLPGEATMDFVWIEPGIRSAMGSRDTYPLA